jgi:catalase
MTEIAKENDHYSQPGNLFEIMTAEAKQNTINNIGAMSGIEGLKGRNN